MEEKGPGPGPVKEQDLGHQVGKNLDQGHQFRRDQDPGLHIHIEKGQ